MQFIGKLWRGEVSLWQAFWLGLVAVQYIVILFSYLFVDTSKSLGVIILWGVFSFATLIWALVGTWRSARRYAGARWKKNLAKGTVIIIALFQVIIPVVMVAMGFVIGIQMESTKNDIDKTLNKVQQELRRAEGGGAAVWAGSEAAVKEEDSQGYGYDAFPIGSFPSFPLERKADYAQICELHFIAGLQKLPSHGEAFGENEKQQYTENCVNHLQANRKAYTDDSIWSVDATANGSPVLMRNAASVTEDAGFLLIYYKHCVNEFTKQPESKQTDEQDLKSSQDIFINYCMRHVDPWADHEYYTRTISGYYNTQEAFFYEGWYDYNNEDQKGSAFYILPNDGMIFYEKCQDKIIEGRKKGNVLTEQAEANYLLHCSLMLKDRYEYSVKETLPVKNSDKP